MWDRRKQARVFLYDRHLFDDKNMPHRGHSLDYLEAWKRTRELAIKAFAQGPEETSQRRITEWFKPKLRREECEGHNKADE